MDDKLDRKGLYVLKISKQLHHWGRRSVRMESLSEFVANMSEVDHIFSLDIYREYYKLLLHPAMRDGFIFRYHGQYYRCIALQLGCSLAPWLLSYTMRMFT